MMNLYLGKAMEADSNSRKIAYLKSPVKLLAQSYRKVSDVMVHSGHDCEPVLPNKKSFLPLPTLLDP